MTDAELRDWAMHLAEEAQLARSDADLQASRDLADVALDVVRGDNSAAGVEAFVMAAAVKVRSQRNADENFECHLLAMDALDRARETLTTSSPALAEAHCLNVVAQGANSERDDSAVGLQRAFDDSKRLAGLNSRPGAFRVALQFELEAAQFARRLGDRRQAREALERAEDLLFHLIDPELTCRFYFARSLHEFEWGSESEGDECLYIAGRLAERLPLRRILHRFAVASLELRFGSVDEGGALLDTACTQANERGFHRAARVGRKDLAALR